MAGEYLSGFVRLVIYRKDTYVCEIGSGSGRILNMLNSFDPKKILAVEPYHI